MISLRGAAALAAAFLSLSFTSSPLAALAIVCVIVTSACIGYAVHRRLRPPVPVPTPIRNAFTDVDAPRPLPRSPFTRVR